jgi:xylulokinase
LSKSYIIGHDVGTGGSKSVLADTDGKMLAHRFEPYPISYPKPLWVEQDPEDWWKAVTKSTRRLLDETGVSPSDVAGVGFAGQMAGVVPVDAAGDPSRPPIIWLDSRADEQAARMIRRLGGDWVMLRLAGALPTGKDVVCKIAWVKENEPDVYARTSRFLDVTGYLVLRATGKIIVDHTGAGATGMLDNKTRQWSRLLARLIGLELDKMPEVKSSIEVVGGLTPDAAGEMGLPTGTPVIAGMGDIPAAATGSGALEDGDAHIYLGTSSWLCLSVAKSKNLGRYGIAAVASPDPGMLIMIGESETAGACLKWFADRLARPDELAAAEGEMGIFRIFDEAAARIEPGSGRLLFMPWLFGERSPVPDTTVRGCFANLSLEHGRDHMLRAVYEGVAYNLRWLIEAVDSKGWHCDPLRAIGGGAKSDLWMQIMADVTGRRIEAVEDPQEAGALGCALAVAVALGVYSDYKDIKKIVKVRRVFEPQAAPRPIYEKLYENYRTLYPALSKASRSLNT